MSFVETQLPTEIARDIVFGAGWKTEVVVLNGGDEQRNQVYNYPRHFGSVTYGAKQRDQMHTMRTHHMAMQGSTHSFRVKNWLDFKSCDPEQTPADTDQLMYQVGDLTQAVGDGVETEFQLAKNYITGTRDSLFLVLKPVAGIVVSLDTVSQPSGWTLDTTTGVVTFAAAPGVGSVPRWGGTFDLPCRFVSDDLPVQNVGCQHETVTFELIETRDIA